MPHHWSIVQIRVNARAQAARIQSRARRVARDNQRRLAQRVRALTSNGTRSLTPTQMRLLARESADYVRNRMK